MPLASLATMCLQGSAAILIVLAIRAILGRRLPRLTFYILWIIVLARLLIPLAIPCPLSIWPAMDNLVSVRLASVIADPSISDHRSQPSAASPVSRDDPAGLGAQSSSNHQVAGPPDMLATAADMLARPPLRTIWLAGVFLATCSLMLHYTRALRRLHTLPFVSDPKAARWLARQKTRRTIHLRQSGPGGEVFTYGVARPTIVVPADFPWDREPEATLVLRHELVHIRRFDPLLKALVAVATCVWWFDPLVWLMRRAFSQDMELSCDELVVARLPSRKRTVYARVLLAASACVAPTCPRVPLAVGTGLLASSLELRIRAALRGVRLSTSARLMSCALVPLVALFALTGSMPQSESSIAAQPGQAPSESTQPGSAARQQWGSEAVANPAPAQIREAAASPSVPSANTSAVFATHLDSTDPWQKGMVLITPRYSVLVPDEVFPDGFTWSFEVEPGATTPTPQGATDVLVIRSKATGDIALIGFCLPANGNLTTELNGPGAPPLFFACDFGWVDDARRERAVLATSLVYEAVHERDLLLGSSGQAPVVAAGNLGVDQVELARQLAGAAA